MPKGTTTEDTKEDLDLFFPEEPLPRETTIQQDMARAVETVVVEAPSPDGNNPANNPLIHQLESPLPKGVTKTRKGARGVDLEYLEWHFITRQLNRILGYGHWSTEIKEVRYLGGDANDAPRGVMVRMALTVEFPGLSEDRYGAGYNRSAIFENTGYAPNKNGDWDMLEMATGAATQTAFKRCATAMGDQFGLSLYEKGEEAHPAAAAAPVHSPVASSSPSNTGTAPVAYLGQEYFECQDCGKQVKGYSSKTGKVYTTADLWDMSMKQTGGLYCYNCKPRHSKR